MLSIKAIARLGLIAFFSMPMITEAIALHTSDTDLAQSSSALAVRGEPALLLAGGAHVTRVLARRKIKKRIKKKGKKAKKYHKKFRKGIRY